MSERDANSEIRALFAAYGAAFDDADAESVTALFAWPATIWQLGEGHVFEDADDLAENVEALMEVFDGAGIVVTTPAVRDVRIAGAAHPPPSPGGRRTRPRRVAARVHLPLLADRAGRGM